MPIRITYGTFSSIFTEHLSFDQCLKVIKMAKNANGYVPKNKTKINGRILFWLLCDLLPLDGWTCLYFKCSIFFLWAALRRRSFYNLCEEYFELYVHHIVLYSKDTFKFVHWTYIRLAISLFMSTVMQKTNSGSQIVKCFICLVAYSMSQNYRQFS